MLNNVIKAYLLNLPRFIKRILVILVDLLICLFTVWLAFGLRLDRWSYLYGAEWWTLFAAVGFSIPLFLFLGLYRTIFRYVGSAVYATMLRVFFIYTLLFFSLFTLIGIDEVPHSIGVIQPILFFIVILKEKR